VVEAAAALATSVAKTGISRESAPRAAGTDASAVRRRDTRPTSARRDAAAGAAAAAGGEAMMIEINSGALKHLQFLPLWSAANVCALQLLFLSRKCSDYVMGDFQYLCASERQWKEIGERGLFVRMQTVIKIFMLCG